MPNYDVRAIANEFFDRAQQDGMRLTNMQLQKLPYIAQGWGLTLRNEPLIKNIPQAWRYGPVYPDLYQALRRYGSGNVLEPIRENDEDVLAFLNENENKRGAVVKAELSPDESLLLDAVWQNYKTYSAFQLSAMTHRENTPWTQAYNEGGDGTPITNERIKPYYDALRTQ